MPSDLESALVEGGVSPSAAKLLANAIDNAATGRLSIGRQVSDATPRSSMRLIDSDTRKYVLQNLDHSTEPGMAARLKPTATPNPSKGSHPYQGSQPATSTPTIATPGVTGGSFVSVGSETKGDVAQSQVTLNVRSMGGSHARLNQSTGQVESVPISVQVEPKEYLEASVEEGPDGTIIKIRLRESFVNAEFHAVTGVFPMQIVDSVGGNCQVRNNGQNVTAYSWTG